jgi:hypothetical protein
VDAATGVLAHLRQGVPELADDPTPEQVDAWVELAELVSDAGFRCGIRALADYTARQRPQATGHQGEPHDAVRLARRVVQHADAARRRGVTPESAEGAEVVDRILGEAPAAHTRAELLELLTPLEAVVTDARGERYWELVAVINGWPPYPATVPSLGTSARGCSPTAG